MDVDSHVAAWPRILLKELPCNTSASTTEVKHRGVGIQGHAGDDRYPIGVIKIIRVGSANHQAQFHRQHRNQ
ncbi:MAG: hypothetical protein AUH71_00205 [Thaumarchaeota archaeon 13_1_40CM_4_48_7]|nr:MAG: hypothetical protein AUH71_00205 [Thaumarchaeota archaeon 13_1_40CM_4_48_7]